MFTIWGFKIGGLPFFTQKTGENGVFTRFKNTFFLFQFYQFNKNECAFSLTEMKNQSGI